MWALAAKNASGAQGQGVACFCFCHDWHGLCCFWRGNFSQTFPCYSQVHVGSCPGTRGKNRGMPMYVVISRRWSVSAISQRESLQWRKKARVKNGAAADLCAPVWCICTMTAGGISLPCVPVHRPAGGTPSVAPRFLHRFHACARHHFAQVPGSGLHTTRRQAPDPHDHRIQTSGDCWYARCSFSSAAVHRGAP